MKTTTAMFEFDVAVRLEGDGLLGGIHEYAPYLAVHGTFGEYKLAQEITLKLANGEHAPKLANHERRKEPGLFDFDEKTLHYATAEPLRFKLQYTQHTRGDETVWFELWCHTRNSGLGEIDAHEARYTERHSSCGLFPLELYTLLRQHAESKESRFAFSQSICDDKVVAHRLQEYSQEQGIVINGQNRREYIGRAMEETRKGTLHFEVEMHQFDAQLYPHSIFGRRHMKRDHLCAVMPLGGDHNGLYVDDDGALRWGGSHIKKREVHWRDKNGREHKHKELVLEGEPAGLYIDDDDGLRWGGPHIKKREVHWKDKNGREHKHKELVVEGEHNGLYIDDDDALRWAGPHIKKREVHWRDKNGREHKHKELVLEGKTALGDQQTVSSSSYTPVLYNSEKGVQCMMRAMEHQVLGPYARHFMQLERTGPAPLITPLNAQIAQLQMPMWVSKMGQAPVYAYWACHDPTTREYADESMRQRDLELYGFTVRTEKLLLTMLNSSLRRHGLSAEAFEREIRTHFAPENKSQQLSTLLRLCEKVLADTGTFAANSANYTADFRFVTRRDPASGKRVSKMIVLDSWDNTILNGVGNSDDCEGMDNTATTIIRAYATGRHTLGFAWESPLLNACQMLLRHTVIYDVGATVTSAYMDADHKKIDMKNAKDLPMVGDKTDLAAECGGHCHALWEPLTVSLDRLRNGNTPAEVLQRVEAAVPACPAFQARDRQRQTLVLEPTSSIEPYILPVKETCGDNTVLLRKECAGRQFQKALRARLEARMEKVGEKMQMKKGMVDFRDMLGPEGLPYYVEKQHPNRRVSSFYDTVVHATSLELMKFDTSLAQLAFCSSIDGRMHFGAKIADMLRNRSKYALMTPFSQNRAEWQQQVRPLVESLQHQLPFMAFGRYTEAQTEKICSRYNLTEEINAQYKFTGVGASEKLRQKSAAEFERLAHSVAENPDLSIVPLYSRDWKFGIDAQQTAQLKQFIAETPGLVAHAYYIECHVVPLGAAVEILCIINNKAYEL